MLFLNNDNICAAIIFYDSTSYRKKLAYLLVNYKITIFDLSKVLPGTYTWAFHTGQVSVSELASSPVRFDSEYWWSDAAIEQVSLMSLDGKRLAHWDLVQASQKVMLPEGQGFFVLQYFESGIGYSTRIPSFMFVK